VTDVSNKQVEEVDVVVVGAGFAGMYLLHLLRGQGFNTVVIEAGTDVGGTWYWNRYPGARCDVPSLDYSYSFDTELEQEWEWSEKYATQPEILSYAQHVADRFDLRRDIRFETRVESAIYDESTKRWTVTTDDGAQISTQFHIMATGCLSTSKKPEVPGLDSYQGQTFHTGHWPHEPVDFTGMKVAVIGTGSSGIQSIPVIAEQAAELTVFQRTPNFSIPAANGPVDPEEVARVKATYQDRRHANRWSAGGVDLKLPTVSAHDVGDEERTAAFEAAWQVGGIFSMSSLYTDLRLDLDANKYAADFARGKIRSRVNDPEVAEKLCPTDYPYGTKRMCVDSRYFETFNQDHVRLVDIRENPISQITPAGLDTAHADGTTTTYEFDAIVYATGFDAMTGTIVSVDVQGVGGATIKERWEDGPRTYLGLMVADFPNFFTVTGPGSPSVLSNMMIAIEQHAEWITDCISHIRDEGLESIAADPKAQTDWVDHVNELANLTLMPQANSWYMGANVPGKPRVFMPYIGGVGPYREICDSVATDGYRGFVLA
jgi:cation diffusion facilitator CzcD-associated flavoprotein CzcO